MSLIHFVYFHHFWPYMRGMGPGKKEMHNPVVSSWGEELETLLAIAFTLQTVFIPGSYPQSTKKIRKF